jgi:uncharacterized damage-inducible protein DinB
MLPIFEAHLNLLESQHNSICQAIADLPSEALDWSPGPEMNSMGIITAHVAGSMRYWIGDIAGNEPSDRNRETEFQTQRVDAAALVARLEAALTHSRTVLERLTLEDLNIKRFSPRHGEEYSVPWALLHALEHTALHVGHIQVTRQLWAQQKR